MAHQSLYREYRPKSFDEVVGQEQVTKPLQEAVKAKKIGHAYLFAGSRGLGKTSVARIFAKEIGCSERDLYEIDAASSNSVDDIRALAEGVYTLPFESPYKVYILDEVHMLSKSAWNAFLKTLEEPPSHAVFILATTELDRVPETVQSRCQVFEFKKPTLDDVWKVLKNVASKEGVELTPDVIVYIAGISQGSYRDALSELQKIMVGTGYKKKITFEDVEIFGGVPKTQHIYELLSALSAGNRSVALAAIEKANNSGANMKFFLDRTIEFLRYVLIMKYAPDDAKNFFSLAADEEEKLREFSTGSKITDKTLLAFLTASDRIRYAPIPALPLELAVLELFPE